MRRPALCLFLALLAVPFAPDPMAIAQTRRAMTPVDLIEAPRVLDPQLSPDGSQVLYVLDRADWQEGARLRPAG
jgi:hypothetical protein